MQRLKEKLTSSVLLEGTDLKKQKRAKRKAKLPKKKYWKFNFGDPAIYCDDLWRLDHRK